MFWIENIHYKNWQNCYRLFNDSIELVAVTDIGPRIIRCGFLGGENLFFEEEKTLGLTGGDEWRLYGGHRLWHAPEALPRTYYPDNEAVISRIEEEKLILSQGVEKTTGIKKEMILSIDPIESKIEIIHRLHNLNMWPVELAPWALSMMAPGGRAIVPLPPKGVHPENLVPSGSISIWPYTNMSDPRWRWGNQFVFLDHDSKNPAPQKAGFYVVDGWVCYQRGDDVFVKLFDYVPGAEYPDRNVNVELFVNDQFLELETLGRLATISPGKYVSHKETWLLFKETTQIQSENDVMDAIPKIKGKK